MTVGRSPQAIVMERRRPTISALDDHAVARAGASVTGRAVDVEALPPASHDVAVDAKRKHRRIDAIHFAGVEERVFMKLPACDGSRHDRARRAVVVKERRLAQGDLFWWVVHVLTAARHRDRETTEKECPQRHPAASATMPPCPYG